jgi:hypothetical protein
MHARRFACMLLGFWLAGSMVMAFLAADSANTAGRLLIDRGPAAGLRIQAMGREEARLMLAYPVRQQVRWWLEEWENLELAVGAFFFLFLLFGTREGKLALFLTLGIYAITLFERFFTLPQMLYLGAAMDFVPVNVVMPERNEFIAVQNAFIGVEIVKALLILGLGAYMIARTRRSSHAWNQVDLVDESNHRHVDG